MIKLDSYPFFSLKVSNQCIEVSISLFIHISQITNDAENIFLGYSIIHNVSFMKYLFNSVTSIVVTYNFQGSLKILR